MIDYHQGVPRHTHEYTTTRERLSFECSPNGRTRLTRYAVQPGQRAPMYPPAPTDRSNIEFNQATRPSYSGEKNGRRGRFTAILLQELPKRVGTYTLGDKAPSDRGARSWITCDCGHKRMVYNNRWARGVVARCRGCTNRDRKMQVPKHRAGWDCQRVTEGKGDLTVHVRCARCGLERTYGHRTWKYDIAGPRPCRHTVAA